MSERSRIDTLLRVQAVDMRIADLESRQAEIPQRRAEVAREITTLEQEQREREQTRERDRLERRHREGDLETQQAKLRRYEMQLNDVKTNVAYSALLTEIQGAKRTIGTLEEEILVLMSRREEDDLRLQAIATELEEKRSAAREALEALATEAAEVERALAEARAERDMRAAGVEPAVYRLYDRLRRGRRFPALVPLRGQACGACHGRMPPQVVREITHDGALHPCEACGVLAYAEPSSAASEPAPERVDVR